ncbi:MAG TPA: hypothetical protein VFA20_11280 [Myxococcaceae bacterium]|nr:hypothetical protein [Myxococcaceae bacterium]
MKSNVTTDNTPIRDSRSGLAGDYEAARMRIKERLVHILARWVANTRARSEKLSRAVQQFLAEAERYDAEAITLEAGAARDREMGVTAVAQGQSLEKSGHGWVVAARAKRIAAGELETNASVKESHGRPQIKAGDALLKHAERELPVAFAREMEGRALLRQAGQKSEVAVGMESDAAALEEKGREARQEVTEPPEQITDIQRWLGKAAALRTTAAVIRDDLSDARQRGEALLRQAAAALEGAAQSRATGQRIIADGKALLAQAVVDRRQASALRAQAQAESIRGWQEVANSRVLIERGHTSLAKAQRDAERASTLRSQVNSLRRAAQEHAAKVSSLQQKANAGTVVGSQLQKEIRKLRSLGAGTAVRIKTGAPE